MQHERQEFRRLLEERLSHVSRDISRARHEAAQAAHDVLARARATLDDMAGDYGAPPPRGALRRKELHALRRHLQLTATLLPHLSNLDDPGWVPAHEEYDRSWDELHRSFESESGAAPP